MTRLLTIVGSQRENAQSEKVARFIETCLPPRGIEGDLVLLNRLALPLWTDDPVASQRQSELWAPVARQIVDADGLVIITPEWNGMVPPILKNFFLYCTGHELTDRPALIVGVSSGGGGSSPASELRLSSYRDTQICYLPEQVLVRSVNEVLNEPEAASESDAFIRVRIDYALGLLAEYAEALKRVRASGARNFDLFPYGM